MRPVVCMWIALLLHFGCLLAAAPLTLPDRPEVMPEFHVPRENTRALGESWVYTQTLYDGLINFPGEWGAVPVGFVKAPQGRAFIASLHTVFRTADGGRSWTNMDPQPAPSNSPSFNSFRSPNFISDITVRPIVRPELNYDSLFLSVFNSSNSNAVVRLIRGFGGGYVIWPDSILRADRWLTSIAATDSHTVVALAGLDARIFRNDSIGFNTHWDTLAEHFTGTWVKELTSVGNFTYAVGSSQWLTLDRGYSWQLLPAADVFGDVDIDFSPTTARGLVCGGLEDPPAGWIRYTTDFGQSWSARTLQTDIPLRTVFMLTDSIGFAAGGIADSAVGRVYRTDDGGVTWRLDLEVDAEITELGYARESGGYVNVIAAGYFADFRCGVWRSHLQLPDTSGAALVFSQDTLFFDVPVGENASQEVSLKNVGHGNVNIFDWFDIPPFTTNCCTQDVLLLPGDSMVAEITFSPTVTGDVTNGIRVLNDRGDFVELRVVGSTSSDVKPQNVLPGDLELSVYPNPGNAEFSLSYRLSRNSDVALRLFDITGREVSTLVNDARAAGNHVIHWNASDMASGVYFAVLSTGEASAAQKLVILK